MSDKEKYLKLVCFIILLFVTIGFASQRVEYIAHRGASSIAPENTMSSVLLAWELGADFVEVDVRMTHDNHIVVIHDGDTKRVSNIDLKVSEASLQELQKLDVGSWKDKKYTAEKIPLLKEIIDTIPKGKRLLVEVKCGEKVLPYINNILSKSNKQKQIAIISSSFEVVKGSKMLMPDIPAYWLIGTRKDKDTEEYIPHNPDWIKTAIQNNIDGLNVHYAGVDDTFMKAVRDAGQELYVYTINDPQIASRLIRLGVRGITTDRPSWLRFQMESIGEDKANFDKNESFSFIQICDIQLGFSDYEQDIGSFRQAVRQTNELNPDFVVICGDLVNTADNKSFSDFKEIKSLLQMPCYCVPGNHDIGNKPTSKSLQHYRKTIGRDYFVLEHKGATFIFVNSQLWKEPLEYESEKQDLWLKEKLKNAFEKRQQIFVVGHYPLFCREVDEPEGYMNLPIKIRKELLGLFEQYSVVAVLGGHAHRLILNHYNEIQMVNAEAVSKNFDKRSPGFRLWHVKNNLPPIHKFIPL